MASQMTFKKFFELCCEKAGVEPTGRQRRNFVSKRGAAYEYAARTGNAKRGIKLALREGYLKKWKPLT